MPRVVAYTGNEAVAEAMRQIEPDVVAAYPITPQTEVVQTFSGFVNDGVVKTEMITVESEHSAMSACVGAAAAGGRVMTATSANGLALMWEILYCASGNRLPMVMTVVNRAMSAPINIHCDHSDSMGARDTGWIQLYSENAQEAYDNIVQAVTVSENRDILLPVMVCVDGFIISHSIERVELLDDNLVKDFIGEYMPAYPLLDLEHPKTFGPLDLNDFYIEHKRQQHEAMKFVPDALLGAAKRFEALTGRKYGLVEGYKLDDAEVAIVVLNSAAGTTRAVVDMMREKGVKAGLLKIRMFRPFPSELVAQRLGHCKAVAILDRSDSFGAQGGPVAHEVRSAICNLPTVPKAIQFVYGLGGRDLNTEDVANVFEELQKIARTGKVEQVFDYITVRN
ncbi:MAG TPA: pyruvate ferredoxin oxidoreductase [bacterium]|nr:pyruvate ferredoxin oxidoreductase [bacterium]